MLGESNRSVNSSYHLEDVSFYLFFDKITVYIPVVNNAVRFNTNKTVNVEMIDLKM